MLRTAEQKAADDGLREAILAADEAYTVAGDSGPQFLQGYVVVAAFHRPTFDEGSDASSLAIMYPDGEQPEWKTLGMLAAARLAVEGEWRKAGDMYGDED